MFKEYTKREDIQTYALIAGVHILAYYLSFGHYFQSDDFNLLYVVKQNSAFNLLSNVVVKWYRPLPMLIHNMNYEIFGMNPKAFGATSIAFSILAAIALYLLLKEYKLPEPVPRCASVIFCVHFAHTESVVWYTSVGEITMVLFTILALLAYKRRQTIAGCVFFVFALLSKETGAAFLPLILLFDLHNKEFKLKRYVPYTIIMLLYIGFRMPGLLQPANDGYTIRFGMNIIKNTGYLLSGLMVPLPFDRIQEGISELGIFKFAVNSPIISVVIAFSLFSYILMWFKIKETRVYLIAMFISFLPVIFLTGSGQRFLLLPSVFFCIAASLSLGVLTRGKCCYRFIYPIILMGFLIYSQFNWVESGKYTKRVTDKIAEIAQSDKDIERIYIINNLDNMNGAYSLRNGTDKLGYLFTENIQTIRLESITEAETFSDSTKSMLLDIKYPFISH